MLILFFMVCIFFFIPFFPLGGLNYFFQGVRQGINFFLVLGRIEKTFSIGLVLIFFCIIIYRFIYFKERKDFLRFFLLLFIFFFSIFLLIIHNRSIVLFLGWDGLGVSSYLLVCYYYNWKSLNGGIVTLITNRIGDICFFWFLTSTILFSNPTISFYMISSPILIFLCGSFTKRAQRPFSSWLPQAMRAPTPVSSLVHSRTLVTAGVYICLKYFCFFSGYFFLFFITICGVITIFVAGLTSLTEKDTKKIVALRTLSQIGLLIFSLGMSIPTTTFFHLITHAIFKRCIFLQVGFYILASFGRQERRVFSSVYKRSPTTNFFFFGGSVSLCGLFFSRGFLRKDLIISFRNYSNGGFYIQFFFLLGIFFTFIYTLRILVFIGGRTPSVIYSFFSYLPFFFSSLPLFLGGILGGWLIINNSILRRSREFFLIKFIPFFFIFLSFFFSFLRKGGETFILDICFQDKILKKILFLNFFPRKSLDFSLNKNISLGVGEFFFIWRGLKKIRIHWPLGGTSFIFFLIFFFF